MSSAVLGLWMRVTVSGVRSNAMPCNANLTVASALRSALDWLLGVVNDLKCCCFLPCCDDVGDDDDYDEDDYISQCKIFIIPPSYLQTNPSLTTPALQQTSYRRQCACRSRALYSTRRNAVASSVLYSMLCDIPYDDDAVLG